MRVEDAEHLGEGYAGQYTDTETGTQYLRARYYDPGTGNFLTRDPLEPITGTPYAYGGNSPLNFADPSGLNKCEVGANPLRWAGNAVDCTSNPDHSPDDLRVADLIVGNSGGGRLGISGSVRVPCMPFAGL